MPAPERIHETCDRLVSYIPIWHLINELTFAPAFNQNARILAIVISSLSVKWPNMYYTSSPGDKRAKLTFQFDSSIHALLRSLGATAY